MVTASVKRQQSDEILSSFLECSVHPLIVILGPTASGKTSFSVKLAETFQSKWGRQVEVVNADSRQLYKYLNIGTAKITKEEMQGVPHHLIDVLDPKEEASAGWFQKEAQKVISEIHQRGNVPLLVGGSMLYISSITDGLSMAPLPSPELRERLMKEYGEDNGESLHQRLREIDPETADKVHPENKPRLVRAVEIYELTKKPKSEAVPQTELRPKTGGQENMLIFGMHWPREELFKRIDLRTEEMFAIGWVEEVKGLLDRGYGPQDPGMKSHGYREIMEALLSWQPFVKEVLIELIAAKSRQYARRQLCWWRHDERIHWV
jgi:tRNA dimethylallyltransferase